MNKNASVYKPGEKVKTGGEIAEINTRGNPTGNDASVDRGDRYPPTEKKGYAWKRK